MSPDIANSAPQPRNMSIGDGNRLVEVNWRGYAVESTQGPFGTSEPIAFDSESGLYYELSRGYNPSMSATGCETFSLADFTLKQTTFEPYHEDTQFSATDENPLVAYKVRINYEGNLPLPESECKWTHVGFCYERPYVEWIHGSFTGYYDDNGAPIVTLEWAEAGPLSTTAYDLWRNGQYDIYDVTGTSITFAIGGHPDSIDVTHEFGVRAVNLYDGCLSDLVTCTVTVPGDLSNCPSKPGEILLKTNIVGPVYNENGDLVGIKIQLVWSGETGSYIKIFRSFEGCDGEFEEIGSVPVTQNYYYDILKSGQIAYYYVEGRRNTCVDPIGKSDCYAIDVSPMTGLNEGTVYFYVRDHLGNSRLVLDVDGNIQSRFNYEPYGVELTPLGANTTNEKYKFTGQERDYDTGMDYMHFRYYASSMGRFLKPDNLIGNIANPQSWNLYSYVNGNPVNFNDPTGHDCKAGSTKQVLFGQGGALGLSDAYGGMWEDPQEKGTMAGGYGGTAEYSGSEIRVTGHWEYVNAQIGMGGYEQNANGDWMWTESWSDASGWVFKKDNQSSWLSNAYGKTIGLANRGMATAVFLGPQLGKLLFTRDWYFGKYGTIIVENKWYTDKLDAYAVTYGNLIVLDPDVYKSGKYPNDLIKLFNEEYAHETQEGRYGPLFYFLYGVDFIFEGYDNYYERQAKDPNAEMPW